MERRLGRGKGELLGEVVVFEKEGYVGGRELRGFLLLAYSLLLYGQLRHIVVRVPLTIRKHNGAPS